MASGVLLHLLLAGILFHVEAANDCLGYMTSSGHYKAIQSCWYSQFCCGSCENRYCCSFKSSSLSNSDQLACSVLPAHYRGSFSNAALGWIITGNVIAFLGIIGCCYCCYSCCCKNPRPAVSTTTTVVNTQSIMPPPVVQEGPYPAYPAYQPMPTQPAYAGHPMPAGPYQTQPYVAGPPPPYHTVAGPDQPSYLIYPPAQENVTHPLLTDALQQPAYNPAYMQSPKTG